MKSKGWVASVICSNIPVMEYCKPASILDSSGCI